MTNDELIILLKKDLGRDCPRWSGNTADMYTR